MTNLLLGIVCALLMLVSIFTSGLLSAVLWLFGTAVGIVVVIRTRSWRGDRR